MRKGVVRRNPPKDKEAAKLKDLLKQIQRAQQLHKRTLEQVRQAEAALKQERELVIRSDRRFRALIDTLPQGIFLKDNDLNYVACNAAHARVLGLASPKNIEGKRDEAFFPSDLVRKYRADDKRVLEHGETVDMEETGVLNGREMAVQTVKTPMRDEHGHITGVLGIYWDISERKAGEANLKLFRYLLDKAIDGIEVVDPVTLRFIDVNEAICRMHGYSREEMLSMRVADLDPYISKALIMEVNKALKEKRSATLESLHLRKDGSIFPVEVNISQVQILDQDYRLAVVRDISDRKQAETALAHANRALKTLGTVNRELVHATCEAELMRSICKAIVEQSGYRMAWVGYARDNADKDIELQASAGVPEDVLEEIRPGWGDDPRAVGPTGRAIRTGETQLSRDIASEPHHDWKDAMLKAGCASSIALPLKGETGAAFGLLHVYADEVNAFADDEIRLLEEMAGDLAFGVDMLRVRVERDEALKLNEQHLARMRQNLDETIAAITKAVEARDPYTAGHQRRVAKLAVAIARRMGLDEDTLQGIHMGAMIHDLGKINIPAEILSKPSHLNGTEILMIRMHPRIGYDILKDIHFPWPVAEIAYQHHEHIDGSGYPQGLKGDQICLEARIVAVADVVEAMTSHRPYRPGLGQEAAIAEISNHRGKFYDLNVVDACLKVIDDGFGYE